MQFVINGKVVGLDELKLFVAILAMLFTGISVGIKLIELRMARKLKTAKRVREADAAKLKDEHDAVVAKLKKNEQKLQRQVKKMKERLRRMEQQQLTPVFYVAEQYRDYVIS